MKIMIVGGTSVLGSALKKSVSNFSEVITAGRTNCDIKLDLRDSIESILLPDHIDVVIHTASHFGGNKDNDILEAENINVLGTLKICQAAKKAKAKHLIFISSIFSSLKQNVWNYNIYSLSKRHAEELAYYYCSAHPLPLTILKPSQLYGNEETFRKHQPFFYTIVDKAEKGEDINLYGSNDPKRNYIHIDDLTGIINRVVHKSIQGIYPCTNMEDITYKEIAQAAFKAFKQQGKVCFLKDKPDIPDNIFDKDNTLYEKIGFYPQISIEEGMKKIANYRSNAK